MSPRARGYLFFGGTVVAALVFFRLGIWQWARRVERLAQNAVALTARERPPVALDDSASAAEFGREAAGNRRVSLSGRYDHAGDIVLRGQTEGGVPGVRIVTPLRPFRGDTAVLVQRGFVPSPDALTVNAARLQEPGAVTVTGISYPVPTAPDGGAPQETAGRPSWRRLDLAALRARFPYPIAGFYILQLPDSSLPGLPRRDDAPALDEGPHLSYAVQWFSFAITALVVGYLVGIRRAGESREGRESRGGRGGRGF